MCVYFILVCLHGFIQPHWQSALVGEHQKVWGKPELSHLLMGHISRWTKVRKGPRKFASHSLVKTLVQASNSQCLPSSPLHLLPSHGG